MSRRTVIFMYLPLSQSAHTMVNVHQIESIKEVRNGKFLHTDVYLKSGKVWQTIFTEEQVLVQLNQAFNGVYQEVDELQLVMPQDTPVIALGAEPRRG